MSKKLQEGTWMMDRLSSGYSWGIGLIEAALPLVFFGGKNRASDFLDEKT